MSEWQFKRDTAFRKLFFVPDSFSHPAKMDSQLLVKIVETYTKVGDVILDPMAGSGTTMLACTLGRDVVLVELEEKFCKMMRDNWEEVKMRPQLGHEMGRCEIKQGDARRLTTLQHSALQQSDADCIVSSPPFADAQHNYEHGLKVLGKNFRGRTAWETKGGKVDKIITSPPYTDNPTGGGLNTKPPRKGTKDQSGRSPDSPSQRGLVDKIVTSPPYAEIQATQDKEWEYTGKHNYTGRRCKIQRYDDVSDDNIGNLPYGEIDKIITSPPYGNPRDTSEEYDDKYDLRRPKGVKWGREAYRGRYGKADGQIGELEYGNIDSIITSPPYEGSVSASTGGERDQSSARQREKRLKDKGYDPAKYQGGVGRNLEVDFQYSEGEDNIGNLKSESYLEAMLQVYDQCFRCLKPQGLMILVTKNFIRNKQVVRLDEDTIKLCEQAGFKFLERHYRKLPAQSFWRVIYKQKFPDVETIDHEDVLVFKNQKGERE